MLDGGRIISIFKIYSSQITADKTIKITTVSGAVETDKFLSNSMMNYANFVIEICPNLTTLHFDINSYLVSVWDANPKYYLDELNTFLSSFMNEFLKPLAKGHSELKICLTLTGNNQVSKELKRDDVTKQ
jgi:hypothetical protein